MYSLIFRHKWVALVWGAMLIGTVYVVVPPEGETGPVDEAVRRIEAQAKAHEELAKQVAQPTEPETIEWADDDSLIDESLREESAAMAGTPKIVSRDEAGDEDEPAPE